MANLVPSNPNGTIGLVCTLDYFGGGIQSDATHTGQQNANFLAGKVDAIVGQMGKLGSSSAAYAAGMYATNPDLVMLPYGKSVENQLPLSYGFPDGYFAHKSGGTKITIFSASIYEMQPDKAISFADPRGFTSTSWRNWRAHDGLQNIHDDNITAGLTLWKGIYLDSMGAGPLGAVNPATGVAYTETTWRPLVYGIGDACLALISGSQMVIGNGITGGPRFYNSSGDLINHVDGGLAESFIRNNGDSATAWPTVNAWKQNVQMMIDVDALDKMLWLITNINNATAGGSNFVPASFTDAQVDAWRQFVMASYLIGKGRYSRIEFIKATSVKPYDEIRNNPIYAVNLGAALETATATGSALNGASFYRKAGTDSTKAVYGRRFANGIALVNPTGTDYTGFVLDRTYQTIDGTPVASTITVRAHTGMVLLLSAGGVGTDYVDANTVTGHAAPKAVEIATYKDTSTGGSQVSKRPVVGCSAAGFQSWPGGYGVAAVPAITCYVNWDELQSGPGASIIGSAGKARIDQAIANANAIGGVVKVRTFCNGGRAGDDQGAPAWLKTQEGTFRYLDSQDSSPSTQPALVLGRCWQSGWLDAYDDLISKLAAVYDSNPTVVDFTISGSMLLYAEPLILGLGDEENRAALVGGGNTWGTGTPATANEVNVAVPGAGYSNAAWMTAQQRCIDIHANYFQLTHSSYSFNPWEILYSKQEALSAGKTNTYTSGDQYYDINDLPGIPTTKSLIDYFIYRLGDRAVLENNSARPDYFTYDGLGNCTGISSTQVYGQMYIYMAQQGGPIFIQTANLSVIVNTQFPTTGAAFAATMDGVVNFIGACGVEPNQFSSACSGGQTQYCAPALTAWNTLMRQNATSRFTGAPTGKAVPSAGETYTKAVIGTPYADASKVTGQASASATQHAAFVDAAVATGQAIPAAAEVYTQAVVGTAYADASVATGHAVGSAVDVAATIDAGTAAGTAVPSAAETYTPLVGSDYVDAATVHGVSVPKTNGQRYLAVDAGTVSGVASPSAAEVYTPFTGVAYVDPGTVSGRAVPSAAALSAFVDAGVATGASQVSGSEVYTPFSGGTTSIDADTAQGVAVPSADDASAFVDAGTVAGLAVPDADNIFSPGTEYSEYIDVATIVGHASPSATVVSAFVDAAAAAGVARPTAAEVYTKLTGSEYVDAAMVQGKATASASSATDFVDAAFATGVAVSSADELYTQSIIGSDYVDIATVSGQSAPLAGDASAFVDADSVTGLADADADEVYTAGTSGGSEYIDADVAVGISDASSADTSDFVDASTVIGLAAPFDDDISSATSPDVPGVETPLVFSPLVLKGGSHPIVEVPANPTGFIHLNPDRERNMIDLLDRLRPVGAIMSITCGEKSNIKIPTTEPLATSEKFAMSRFVTGSDNVAWPAYDPASAQFLEPGVEHEGRTMPGAGAELAPIFHTVEGIHTYNEQAFTDVHYGQAADPGDTPPFYDAAFGPPYLIYRSEHIGHYNRQMSLIFPFLQNVNASTDFTPESAIASQNTPLVITVRSR